MAGEHPWYTCFGILHKDTETALKYLRMANACNAALLLTCAVLVFINPVIWLGFSLILISLSCYIFCGGAMLLFFEMRINACLAPIRRDCGPSTAALQSHVSAIPHTVSCVLPPQDSCLPTAAASA